MCSSAAESDLVVDVRNVSKYFPVKLNARRLLGYLMPWDRKPEQGDYWALKGVDIQVSRGEVVGLIGKNGSGKSTLLQIVAGLMNRSGGEVTISGRISALLELGAGFNPDFTGRENIYLSGAIYGLSRAAIRERFDDIVRFADIGAYLDQPVKTYSSGMYARLAFAVSIQVDPDIILVDEILSVGDVAFQSKCFQKIEELRDAGSSIILVSHDMNSIQMFCDRAYLLHEGKIACEGLPTTVITRYIHLLMETEGNKFSGDENGGDAVKDRKAYIRDIGIFDEEGRASSRLRVAQRCVAEYTVCFHSRVECPLVTFQIKTIMGIVVSDVSSAFQNMALPACHPGDQLRARMKFTLNLCPGPYRFGVSIAERKKAGDIPIFGTEKTTIEVIANGPIKAYGIADIDPELFFEHVERDKAGDSIGPRTV